MEHERELTPRQQTCITVGLYWEMMHPGVPLPPAGIIGSWAVHYTLEQITEGIDKAAAQCSRRKITDADSIGRITSSMIRNTAQPDHNIGVLRNN